MQKKMSRREFLKASAATGAILSMAPSITLAEEPKPIQLLAPQPGAGSPLMQLLWKRKSSRQFSSEPLPVEVLSNLLWAGFGISRPDGKRTAPSGNNTQDMDIYVILPDGLYLYDAKANQLKLMLAQDLRGLAGTQAYVKEAPVNLIYVSDYAKWGEKPIRELVQHLLKTSLWYPRRSNRTEHLSLLRFRRIGDLLQGIYRYTSPRKSHETTARSENHRWHRRWDIQKRHHRGGKQTEWVVASQPNNIIPDLLGET